MRTRLLRAVGYFNESYRSYTIDPDLTASVLCAGKTVVFTKRVAVLHHREWVEQEGDDRVVRERGGIDNQSIYREKFKFLQASYGRLFRLRARLGYYLTYYVLFFHTDPSSLRLRLNIRDWLNLSGGRFVSLMDPVRSRKHPYHLVQKVPGQLLGVPDNPYRHLLPDTSEGGL